MTGVSEVGCWLGRVGPDEHLEGGGGQRGGGIRCSETTTKNQNKKSRRGVCCRTVRLPACLCCQTDSRCPRRPDQSNQTNAENIEASLRLPVRGRRCNALPVSSVGCWRYGDQMVDEGRIEREKKMG